MTHDEDWTSRKRKREGDPILDRRVIDGFKVRFSGPQMIITYQSEIKLKEVYKGGFESEIERRINEVKKFLQKEYKAITGKGVTLKKAGDPKVLVQSVSRVFNIRVQATQTFDIGGMKVDGILQPSDPTVQKKTSQRSFWNKRQISDHRTIKLARKVTDQMEIMGNNGF